MRHKCDILSASSRAFAASIDVSDRGIRIDRDLSCDDGALTSRADAVETSGQTTNALLGKFPSDCVIDVTQSGTSTRDVALRVAIAGGERVIKLRCATTADATALREAIENKANVKTSERGKYELGEKDNEGDDARRALVRDLREENALLGEALRAAEEALRARDVDDANRVHHVDHPDVTTYEIRLQNMAKSVEHHEERSARLAEDVAEHTRTLERYRSIETALGRENDELRQGLESMKAARDKALRRAEASELMAAHAKNEVEALMKNGDSLNASSNALGELQREFAVVESARLTAETHLNLTLAHLRAAREENVKLTEDLLKKTNESFERDARIDELEQKLDVWHERQSTTSKELSNALQDRSEAFNRAQMFESELKQVKVEVERLIGRLGNAEREALAEKEETRAQCAVRLEEYATEMARQTAAARNAAREAAQHASFLHEANVKIQELEYELHEERRRREDLERQFAAQELAKQTIADFTADAEASVNRSMQAQREAHIELQRVRMEKQGLSGQHLAVRPASTSKPPSAAKRESPIRRDTEEGWRRQLTATLDLHKTLRGTSPSVITPSSGANWSRIPYLSGGAAFTKRRSPTTASERLREIEAEISIIKSRQTPVKATPTKAALEDKFNLQQGQRATVAFETSEEID